jgi:hypothetical protein
MAYHLIHFFTYNKIYLISGAVLLFLIFLPTKEKISKNTRKALFVFLIIWIICFAYRMNTGKDIIYLFNKSDTFGNEPEPAGIKGPFNKYYSNDAGRKTKD